MRKVIHIVLFSYIVGALLFVSCRREKYYKKQYKESQKFWDDRNKNDNAIYYGTTYGEKSIKNAKNAGTLDLFDKLVDFHIKSDIENFNEIFIEEDGLPTVDYIQDNLSNLQRVKSINKESYKLVSKMELKLYFYKKYLDSVKNYKKPTIEEVKKIEGYDYITGYEGRNYPKDLNLED